MIEMTPQKTFEELQEIAASLVTKTQVSGVSRKEALEIVAKGCQLLVDNLKGRASGSIQDDHF